MGRGGLGPLRHAAGFHDDDGLDPCGGARRRHELAGVLDRLDIEQNGSGQVVQREIVEQIGDIDVELIANGYDARKAHPALRRPVHHAGRNGARLGDQRQISGNRRVRGEACVEICAGIMTPRQLGPISRIPYLCAASARRFGQRTRAVTEPGRDDDGPRRPLFAGLIDQAWDRCRRRGDDHEFGRKRQFCQAFDRCHAVDFGMTRIDQCKFAFEFRLANVSENGLSDRPLPRTCSHQGNRTRRQQIVLDDRSTSLARASVGGCGFPSLG